LVHFQDQRLLKQLRLWLLSLPTLTAFVLSRGDLMLAADIKLMKLKCEHLVSGVLYGWTDPFFDRWRARISLPAHFFLLTLKLLHFRQLFVELIQLELLLVFLHVLGLYHCKLLKQRLVASLNFTNSFFDFRDNDAERTVSGIDKQRITLI